MKEGRNVAGLIGLYIAWLVAAGLLVSAAVQGHPYSFYTLLRWICCPIFAHSAFAAHERNRMLWIWVFGVLALLYNPLFRVHLDRSTWTGVNWFTVGVIAIAAAVFLKDKKSATSTNVAGAMTRETTRSAILTKSKVKVICLLALLLVLGFGVVAYSVNVARRYQAFTNELSAVRGIHIGDSREEVKYRLGFPLQVLGPVEEVGEWGPSQRVYTVSGADNDVNKMPSKTKVEDYDEWVYGQPYSTVRLTVKFNKPGFVESLTLYSDNEKPYGWGPIAGLSSFDSEEKVLGWFGQPSRQHLDGVSKTIEYRDIGIVVTLTKGRVYMITIKGPQEKEAVFRRFIHTLP
jgi:outer membrane protein assembly factor BamE (lipoprotein component of BamABCDE complex)